MSCFWGWFERITLGFVLFMMVTIQIVVANEVFSTMSQVATEVFALTFNVLGLLVVALILSSLSGLLADLAHLATSTPLSDHAEWTINCVLGLGAAAVLAYSVLTMSAPYNLNPEFEQTQFILGWVFVGAFAMRARPIRTALMLLSKRQERQEAAA